MRQVRHMLDNRSLRYKRIFMRTLTCTCIFIAAVMLTYPRIAFRLFQKLPVLDLTNAMAMLIVNIGMILKIDCDFR